MHKSLFIPPKFLISEMIILSISGANYSYQYWLQPIILIISPITRMAVISVQLHTDLYTDLYSASIFMGFTLQFLWHSLTVRCRLLAEVPQFRTRWW